MAVDIKELYWGRLGLSREQCADLLGVSIVTIRRAEQGTQQLHPAAIKLLKYFAEGRIMPESWAPGWVFSATSLVNPAGESITPGECQAFMFLRMNGVMQLGRYYSARQTTGQQATQQTTLASTLPFFRSG